MNERINELAEHCDFYVGNEHYDKSREEQQRLFMEKFAELIVRECADVCYGHSDAAGGVGTEFGYGYRDCGNDIKRHFGVSE
jgi:hypothetical protein